MRNGFLSSYGDGYTKLPNWYLLQAESNYEQNVQDIYTEAAKNHRSQHIIQFLA